MPTDLDRIVAAAAAARAATGSPYRADQEARRVAADLGYALPGEDFCLHGLYAEPCPTCEAIFG